MLRTIALLASCIASQAFAANDFVTFDIGSYRINARNNISASGPARRGNSFRIEDQGTPDNDTVLRLEGSIRPFARHRIRFAYFQSTRKGGTSSNLEISFLGTVIPLGTVVNSGLAIRQTELDYLYSFWQSETTEVALSLGAHMTDLKASLSAPSLRISREASASGPLPMIGIAGTTRIGRNWELLGHVYGMSAEVGDSSGEAIAYRVGGRYFFTPHLGIGVAWSGIRYNFDLNRTRWIGELDASNHGGEVFLTMRF